MNFTKEIDEVLDQMAKDISMFCKINSVEGDAKEGMPFGEGPAKALEMVLELGASMGFQTENFENYVGHIDYGNGEDMVGILAHVDVVPAGEGWDHDPWGGEISNGAIWGRGTMDDKGPIIICMYAMKILKELGLPLSKKIRMILGANEETDWKCMDYYINKVKPKLPIIAFSPDASFPVTYAEKGILQFKLKMPYDESIKIDGGNAFNAVPSIAEVFIPNMTASVVQEQIKNVSTTCTFNIKEEDQGVRIIASGKGAHAARLEGGINAISYLMELLGKLTLTGQFKTVVDFYNTYVGTTYYGEKLDIADNDESGNLTFNMGRINIEDGNMVLCCDIRIPVTKDINVTIDKVKQMLATSPFTYHPNSAEASLYVPKDSPLVTTLMEAYKDVTGDDQAQPITAGGGTYSRTIDNCVAFGARLPYQDNTIHQANENLKLEHMKKCLEIYVEALHRLTK